MSTAKTKKEEALQTAVTSYPRPLHAILSFPAHKKRLCSATPMTTTNEWFGGKKTNRCAYLGENPKNNNSEMPIHEN